MHKKGVDFVFVDHPCFPRPGGLYADKFGAYGDNQVRTSDVLRCCSMPLLLVSGDAIAPRAATSRCPLDTCLAARVYCALHLAPSSPQHRSTATACLRCPLISIQTQYRYSLLTLAALEVPLHLELGEPGKPEVKSVFGQDCVFMANDWHTGLLPVYLASRCAARYTADVRCIRCYLYVACITLRIPSGCLQGYASVCDDFH